MSTRFRVVVSAENTPELAWQTELFCFSALTRLHARPTIIVHRSAAPLLPEFEYLRSWGCSLIEAPVFRNHPLGEYHRRNQVWSFFTISWLPEFRNCYILFCEPDMLFVDRLEYPAELSVEHCAYLDYSENRVRDVASKFGLVDRVEQLNKTRAVGPPYFLPSPDIRGLAQRWLQILDSFDELKWIDTMHAFGLALEMEGLTPYITRFVSDNRDPLRKLTGRIVHYRFGDTTWDKRTFVDDCSPLAAVSAPTASGLSGTVLGEILTQIRQARAFARFPIVFPPVWRLLSLVPSR